MTIEEKYNENQQWFIDRIGKTIYRDKTPCDCQSCSKVVSHGLVVYDKSHAEYLNDWSAESGIKYRDNP